MKIFKSCFINSRLPGTFPTPLIGGMIVDPVARSIFMHLCVLSHQLPSHHFVVWSGERTGVHVDFAPFASNFSLSRVEKTLRTIDLFYDPSAIHIRNEMFEFWSKTTISFHSRKLSNIVLIQAVPYGGWPNNDFTHRINLPLI